MTTTGVPDDRERTARAALAAVAAAVDSTMFPAIADDVTRLVITHGAQCVVEVLRDSDASAVRDWELGAEETRLRAAAASVDGEQVLEAGARCGARFICPGDPEWPATLHALADDVDSPGWVAPPLGLWVRGEGDLAAMATQSLAVVGARAATEYGTRLAAEMAAEAASQDWTIATGASYGVEAFAVRGALAVDSQPLVVLPCGVDRTYPNGHADLLARVLDSGLVISQLPPSADTSRQRFRGRSRLLAALTRATVVVEAAVISGALHTAQMAAQIGRPVAAVPGPVTSSFSAGCHALIREGGAVLVTDTAKLLAVANSGSWATEER